MSLAGSLIRRERPPTLDLPPPGEPDLGVGHRRHYGGEDVRPGRGEPEVEAGEARVVDVEKARQRRVVGAAAGEYVWLGKELEGPYGAEDRAEEDDGPGQRDCDAQKAGYAARAVHARRVVEVLRDVLESREQDHGVVPRPPPRHGENYEHPRPDRVRTPGDPVDAHEAERLVHDAVLLGEYQGEDHGVRDEVYRHRQEESEPEGRL